MYFERSRYDREGDLRGTQLERQDALSAFHFRAEFWRECERTVPRNDSLAPSTDTQSGWVILSEYLSQKDDKTVQATNRCFLHWPVEAGHFTLPWSSTRVADQHTDREICSQSDLHLVRLH